jgi:hypothetical protein
MSDCLEKFLKRPYSGSGTALFIGRPMAAIIGVHGTPYVSIGGAAVPGRPWCWRERGPPHRIFPGFEEANGS